MSRAIVWAEDAENDIRQAADEEATVGDADARGAVTR